MIKKNIFAFCLFIFIILIKNTTSFILTNQDGISNSGVLRGYPMSNKIRQKDFTTFPSDVNNRNYFGAIFDGRYMWMVPNGAQPYVTKVDTNYSTEGQMTKYNLSTLPGINLGYWAFTGGTFDGTNIWLIPRQANQLVKINATTGEMTGYLLPNLSTISNGYKFFSGIFDGRYIWLIPYGSRSLIRSDLNGNMVLYDNWPKDFWAANSLNSLFSGGILIERYLYMMPAGAKQIIKLDILASSDDPNAMTTIDFPGGGQFYGGAFDGKYIWMCPWASGLVLKIDKDSNDIIQVASGIQGLYSGAIYDGESVWFTPYSGKLFKINATTNELISYPSFSTGYLGGIFNNSNLWFASGDAGKVTKIESYYTVSGMITNKGTDTPIAGATVTAISLDSSVHQTTSTDTNGFYSFDLTLGNYTISAQKSNYFTISESSYDISLQTNDITLNLMIDLASVDIYFQDISGNNIRAPVKSPHINKGSQFIANSLKVKGYKVSSATLNDVNTTIIGNGFSFTVLQPSNTVVFTYIASNEPISPVSPDDPTQDLYPLEPGTGQTGPLSIDYIPPISFSDHKVSSTNLVCKAINLKPFVQVSDFRGTGSGFKLQAKLSAFNCGDFLNCLPGSFICLNNGFSLSQNSEFVPPNTINSVILYSGDIYGVDVLIAPSGTGKGTSITRWYPTLETSLQNNNVFLTAPSGAVLAGTYNATITWSLIDAP